MTWGIKQDQNARRKKNKSIWEYNWWENKNDFDENKMNIILKLCDTEMENINTWNKGDYR